MQCIGLFTAFWQQNWQRAYVAAGALRKFNLLLYLFITLRPNITRRHKARQLNDSVCPSATS